jgi:predicted dehydrogenase
MRTRIGLAGLGDIGRLHAKALAQRADVELCVCRGVNPARAEAFARDYDARVYADYAAMLADDSVAAVDICVPNDLHRRYVERAAAAGKHVLCEKPIALTLEDGAAMIDACLRAGVLFLVAHPLRFWPEYVRMREVLRAADLGRCLAITMRRMLSLLISVRGEGGWRHKPERMGGAVLDLQIHDLDFLCWTFGVPERVYCAGAQSADGGWNHVYSVLFWPSALSALVEASYLLQGDPMIFTAKAVCEAGTLDYALDLREFDMHAMAGQAAATARHDPATLVCYRAGRDPEVLVRQPHDILGHVFGAELSYFVDCVQLRRENDVAPPGEALDALAIALACAESAVTGQPARPRARAAHPARAR